MRSWLTLFLLSVHFFSNAAISDTSFAARELSIRWQAVTNDYNHNSRLSLNALTVRNNGRKAFPATGWKMYFNSARLITSASVSGNALFSFVNGDLFSLTPTSTFHAIAPGDSLRIEYIAEEPVVNITDGPEGFYIVWDDFPSKGFATGAFSTDRFEPDYAGLVSPEIIFQQNAAQQATKPGNVARIFPTPTSYRETGRFFGLTSGYILQDAGSQFANELQLTKKCLDELLTGRSDKGGRDTISLSRQPALASEAYELSVQEHHIFLRASTPAGIFYALQSLKSLIPPEAWKKPAASIRIPTVEVADSPRFALRAFMLDVGRNFQLPAEVMRVIDVMALYKLNVLHLHLTEDEGWRIALPSLPELTSVGAERGHTLDSKHFLPPSHGSGADTAKMPGSGFYSRTEYISLLQYATERHILVIPEIETPGHARAAIKAMNARYEKLMAAGNAAGAEKFLLYDRNDSSKYSGNQYWTDNIIDVSLPSTYHFIETVIDDLVAIYREAGAPLHTIHFGGDEVPAHVWEKSPAFAALQKTNPEIKTTADCWYYFYGRVNDLLRARGLFLSGWEEMGLRKTQLDGRSMYIPNPDFTRDHLQTDVWNNTLGDGNEDLAYKMANAGYRVMLTCVTNLYFDMANQKSFDEPGYYWGAFTDLEKPFSFIPYDYFKNSRVDKNGLPLDRSIFIGKQRLTDYGKSNIVGLQSAVWGENIESTSRLEYMLLPRLLAFAERAWRPDPDWATLTDTIQASIAYRQDWSNFLEQLNQRELPRLSFYNGGYNYRIPKPGLHYQQGQYEMNDQFPQFPIRYTTDGTEPGANSKLYKAPITTDAQTLRFRAFDSRGRSSNTSYLIIH